MERGKAVVNTFNRYQAAEYTTCINRCRTAKQWIDFTSDPERNKLFPNLKWLESRSADQREEHQAFYDLILPKDDPFWLENQPGQLWNCKCDWEETDEPASPSAPESVKPAAGLEGNPAITGELFTEKAGYFQGLEDKAVPKIRESYTNIARGNIYNSITLKNITINDQKIEINAKGKGHAVHDLYFSNSVFIKNETLLFFEDFLKNYESVIKRKNYDPLKPNIDFYYYYKLKTNHPVYYLVSEDKENVFKFYGVTDRIDKKKKYRK